MGVMMFAGLFVGVMLSLQSVAPIDTCRDLQRGTPGTPSPEMEAVIALAKVSGDRLTCPFVITDYGPSVQRQGQQPRIEMQVFTRRGTAWEFVGSYPVSASENVGLSNNSDAIPNWTIRREEDAITGTPNVFARTSNARELQLAFRQTVQPSLHVSCYQDTTQVYVRFPERYLGRDALQVRYRIDQRPAVSADWRVASGGDSVGLFLGRQAIPFLRELSGAREFTVRLAPFGEDNWTVQFDTTNIDGAVAEIADACSWNFDPD